MGAIKVRWQTGVPRVVFEGGEQGHAALRVIAELVPGHVQALREQGTGFTFMDKMAQDTQ